MLPDRFLLFLSSTPAMYSKLLKRSGKRVAQDGGQEDSCSELKLQTKAYLQVPKPRGWKRNPPSVIVSHVLLHPCNIFQSKTHSFILYSNDKTISLEKKNRGTTQGQLLFMSTTHEVMPCQSCLISADKFAYFSKNSYQLSQEFCITLAE